MNPNREAALFALALEQPAEKRPAFLDAVCEGDAPLRARLDALLAAHEAPADALATDVAAGAKATIKLDLPEEPPDEAAGQTLGRYKLLEKVGEGGCGVVYVAEQTEPVRRRVALKVIKLGMDTKAVVARFEAERQALAMMDHPNIAKVLDAGTTETGRPYFVMELVRGIRITDYCDQNNLPTQRRLDLFIKVCQAIQHAHQKGIIHRDIKPSNLLVTLHDGVPVPKVIDFGIAKATEGRLTDATVYTQLHQFIGTPAYMSPEQAEMSGLDIDTRSDIYSLGVLLYELLTGRTPFDAQELMSQGIDAMRKTIREKDPVRPSTRLATLQGDELTTTAKRRSVEAAKLSKLLRGDLDWIVMKCLEKDRTRRYETANGLAADIHRHLSNEPVVARPPSAGYRFQKAFRRNKLVFAAGTALALALILGIIGTTMGLLRARKESQAADAARQLTEQRFENALQFVNDVMKKVAPEFEDLVGASKAKEELARSSVRFVESLGDGRTADENFQESLADLYKYLSGSVGGIYAANSGGDLETALQYSERAGAIAEALHERKPNSFERLQKLIWSEHGTGVLLIHLDRPEEGLAHLRRGIGLAESILQSDPTNGFALERLHGAHIHIGGVLERRGQVREALEQHYLPYSRRWLEAQPAPQSTETDAHLSAISHASVAGALLALKQPEDALPHLQAALRWNQFLLERAPNNARFRRDESNLRSVLGTALVEADRSREGLEELRQAVLLAEMQVAQDPANFFPQLVLVRVLHRQSQAFAKLAGEPKNSVAQRADYWRQAIDELVRCEEKLNSPDFQKATAGREIRSEVVRDLAVARAALAALVEPAAARASKPLREGRLQDH